MRIGVLKETKVGEGRVALLPDAVRQLVSDGHVVLVECAAGEGAGYPDVAYETVGAQVTDRAALFQQADLVCKVKEPQPEERPMFEPRHTLFAYLHLAADARLTQDLLATGATFIAFETIEGPDGSLPLLEPMSEIAGRLAVLMGEEDLRRTSGRLVGRVTGVPPTKVVILGAGTVGLAAAEVAVGLGADVVILDIHRGTLDNALHRLGGRIRVALNNEAFLTEALTDASLVVGAALTKAAHAPTIVRRDHLRLMAEGGVFVDVAIDQGGCAETSTPTSHADPTYVVDGITHRCVTNMPGAVPRTASAALSSAIIDHVRRLAHQDPLSLLTDERLRSGINIWQGRLVQRQVAEAHDLTAEELPPAETAATAR